MHGNNNQNNKYWKDKYNEKEDSGKYDNESKTKYKGNRSLLAPFIVLIIVVIIVLIAII